MRLYAPIATRGGRYDHMTVTDPGCFAGFRRTLAKKARKAARQQGKKMAHPRLSSGLHEE